MTVKQKKIVKAMAIILGVLLLIGAVIIVAIQKGRNARSLEDDSPTDGSPTGSPQYTPPPVSTGSPYTKDEIKAMQLWLVQKATAMRNNIILHAISSTGGIDGVMGSGFQTALREAINKGYVYSLDDLFYRTTN